ncbi:hypothetical protein MSAN_00609100 [Mycena sanguinolenta]|uniref:Ricin B lectin domain-containing protein n=1 Tax=Mycena sanguinolenta TaxID=230812 RepID=A0A8H6ZBS1_9AGAR|nr:hypothetical protein MSAN_00609100 [Mycena sanguinolenta]
MMPPRCRSIVDQSVGTSYATFSHDAESILLCHLHCPLSCNGCLQSTHTLEFLPILWRYRRVGGDKEAPLGVLGGHAEGAQLTVTSVETLNIIHGDFHLASSENIAVSRASHVLPGDAKDLLHVPPLSISQPELVHGGIYKIKSCAGSTVLDLNDSDRQSIIGYKWSEGTNQMWTLSDAGGGNWALQNIRYSRKYLGLSGSAAPGVKLRAVDDSVRWSIRPDGRAYTLSVPTDPGLAICLSTNGSVRLWPVERCNTQLWEFTEVSHMLPEGAKDMLHTPPLSPSQPKLVPGRTYMIKNCAGRIVLDLNDSDRQSIVGYKWSEGTNQMWTLSEAGGGNWTLQNIKYPRKYLGLSRNATPSVKLQAVDDSVHWSIRLKGHAYMLSLAINSGLTIEWKGSDVRLFPVDGHNTQLWEFTEVSHMLTEDAKDLLHTPPLSSSQPELVHGHIYKIKNCATYTALDLNDSDHQSIISYKWSGGTNQMWILAHAGGGSWTLQNVKHPRKYLGLSRSAAPGVTLRAVDDSVNWSIQSNGCAYMFVLYLVNSSGLAIEWNGSDVLLCPVDGHNTQLWEFTEVSHMLTEDAKNLLHIPPLSPSQPKLVHGRTYKIKNCATYAVLDLNDSDRQSIIGYKWSEGTNQMWTLSEAGGGNWTLQNVKRPRKYLGLPGSAAPGVKLRAVDDSVNWSIQSNGSAYTLSLANNSGLAVEWNGSDVLLSPVDGHNTQLWEFTEVQFEQTN